MASLFADRRVPKLAICRLWVDVNFIGRHCILYRIHARAEPVKANGHGDKNKTPKPAPDGPHVTPLCPTNSGVKALSEVRRREATRGGFANISRHARDGRVSKADITQTGLMSAFD